jgi:hypothetical protein
MAASEASAAPVHKQLLAWGFLLPEDASRCILDYPISRPGTLCPRVDNYVKALTLECWRRSTHRGGELRASLETGSSLKRWPLAAVDSSLWDWTVALSFAQNNQHINLLEMRASLAALKWRIRTFPESHAIFFHLVDSLVNLAAIAKGRSSSRLLNGILRRYNALLLAANLHPLCGYLRSADNPADAPSRWLHKRKHGETQN